MKNSTLIFGLMASLGRETYSITDLIYLTKPFGVSETGLRTTLSRMAGKGLLSSSRQGKSAFYAFSTKARIISDNVAKGFRSWDWTHWDEMWWAVAFSIPRLENENRYRIRKKLSAYRFVPLYSGFWVRPRHEKDRLEKQLETIIQSPQCRLFQFQPVSPITPEEISTLWNLDKVNNTFRNAHSILVKSGKILESKSPEKAFVESMHVMSEAVHALSFDPILPPRFLPKNWKGDALKTEFRTYSTLAQKISKPFWEHLMK